MKFQQYLNEKFYNATKIWGHDVEIFVNPSKRELRDIQEKSPIGYRYIVDFDNKKIYYWHSEVIHIDILQDFPRMVPQFNHGNYLNYVHSGAFSQRIFTGHGTWGSKEVESDTWKIGGDLWNAIGKDDDLLISKLREFTKLNMTWLNKYLDTKQVKRFAEVLIKRIEDSDPLKYY